MAEHLPEGEYYVSVITEMELLSYPNLKATEEAAIRSCLGDLAIVGLTDDVEERAIALRRTHSVKLPDAVIAATALTLSAELLTCDERLLKLPEIVFRKPVLQ